MPDCRCRPRDHVPSEFWISRDGLDNIRRMSGFIERLHPWLVAVVSMVTWIIILSFVLSFLFDAGISGGWIIAGALISIASFGGLLLTKELTDAILSPEFTRFGKEMAFWNQHGKLSERVPAVPQGTGGFEIAPSPADPRRVILGLCSGELSASNRRRSGKFRIHGLAA